MNDKIINLGSKGLMLAIIVIGVVLSIFIMSYGNPYGMNKEETDAIGLEIAKSENADKQGLTQEQIDERVLQYLEAGGTFYTIDLNKYNNEFVTVRDASLSITTFTMDTIPWFNDNLVDFNKVQETEPDPI